MKLFEQDWSKINLDDIPEDGTVVVKKIVKPKVDTGKKIDTTLPPTPDPDLKPKPKLDNASAEAAQKQFKLIQNAVQFYELISKLGSSSNWDEERMQKIFVKFSMISRSGLDPNEMVKYCDAIYRIIFSMSGTRKKNSKAYEYWLSRNYASSTSWSYLESISLPDFKSYEDWFKGDHFADMDWEEYNNMRYFKRIFSDITPARIQKLKDSPETAKLTLNSKFSNQEIHDMVMKSYKNKIYGTPGQKRSNAAWIK